MIAIIGGTGLQQLPLPIVKQHYISTMFSENTVLVEEYLSGQQPIAFISRHASHLKAKKSTPPHLINYRANIDALLQLDCKVILAFNAVGSIYEEYPIGSWVIPHQIIDYTWGREHSFTSIGDSYHIDFSKPFDSVLRHQLVHSLQSLNIKCLKHAIYACTQGPRLETSAEIQRLKNDGCDVVGMTAMPEACLAKERKIAYVSLCYVLNLAAGIGDTELSEQQVRDNAEAMASDAKKIITRLASNVSL